jgi:hypothetical protein
MKKVSIPHINLKDKGTVDLFFEFLDIPNRKKIVEDLKKGEDILLPNFGNLGAGVQIDNKVKDIEEKDLKNINDEQFIERFLNEKNAPKHPVMLYDNQKHEYKLKPHHDVEQMIQDIIQQRQQKRSV